MSTSTSQGVVDKGAGLDAYYGPFTSEQEKEALSVPLRLVAAWAHNDADGVADVFTEDGILILPGDVYKKGREEIRFSWPPLTPALSRAPASPAARSTCGSSPTMSP